MASPYTNNGAECWLTRYDSKDDTSGTTMYFQTIRSIEDVFNASVTEISTIIYGFDGNFAMDVGTTRKFTLTVERIQPASVNDPKKTSGETDGEFWDRVDYANQGKWSNAFWFNALKHFIDGWQNLNYGHVDEEMKQTGGFEFHYAPTTEPMTGTSLKNLYPTVDQRVVISGQMQYTYNPSSLQKLRISLPLAVATMITSTHVQDQYTVEYQLEKNSDTYVSRKFPKGISSIVPNVPVEWPSMMSGAAFDTWHEYDNTNTYSPGDRVDWNIRSLYATWKEPKYAFYTENPGTTYTKVGGTDFEDVTTAMCILIGHGGNGAPGRWVPKANSWSGYGGGGGSGAYIVQQYAIDDDTTIKIHASNSTTGNSWIEIGSNIHVDAGPGGAGSRAQGPYSAGKGGAGGLPGGISGGDGVSAVIGDNSIQPRGGYGADLKDYFNEYTVVIDGQTIGPFSSDRNGTGELSQLGVGGDGGNSTWTAGKRGFVLVVLS